MRKPRGYWKNRENMENEIKNIIEIYGYFPTCNILSKDGYSMLIGAIQRHYDGFQNFRKSFGYEIKKKPRNYWKNIENVKTEISIISNELGHFPTARELQKLNSSLSMAISTYHSWQEIRSIFGKPSNKKPHNHWKNIENVKKEILPLIEKLNHFPSGKELRKYGLEGMEASIYVYHGGLSNLAEKLGFKSNSKPKNYWTKEENLRKEIENVIEKFGFIPSYNELRSKGFNNLAYAFTYYGGIRKVRETFGKGLNNKLRPMRYWKDFDNAKQAMLDVVRKLGHYPSAKELQKENSSLRTAVVKYYGYNKFRDLMGYKDTKWRYKNLENAKLEFQKIFKTLGHLPTTRELKKLGYGNLVHSIKTYHGGFSEFLESLGYKIVLRKGKDFINFVENNDVAKLIIEKFGNDKAIVSDFISVIYGKKRSDLIKLLDQPSLEPYLGKYFKGVNSLQDLVELEEKTLPLDKNSILEEILKNAALNFMRKNLGPKPSEEKKKDFLNQLETSLYV